jgi:RNA polymerase sigma-70 factor (ECF subfamily)
VTAGLSDEELVAQLQQGHTYTLDALYRRYAKELYTFCFHTTRSQNPQDVEDLVHDVFIRVIKSARTFDPRKASFRTWLYRIARNRCIDFGRRKAKVKFIPIGKKVRHDQASPALENSLADQKDPPEESVLRTSVIEAVRDCINQLENEEEKQAILLYYLGGKVYREIAEILRKSTSTAKNRVESAKDKVRRCLESKDIYSAF